MATGVKKEAPQGRGQGLLKGLKVLITAGPTREYLDPVRFLSNPSSGKMGFALARACLAQGARVTLVSGPVQLEPPRRARLVKVESALEMFSAARRLFPGCGLFIAAAAVSDFRPARRSPSKIKKSSTGASVLRLALNPDIVAALSKVKGKRCLVGFAAETGDLIKNARKKCREKKLDLMVANIVGRPGSGFAGDRNKVTLLWPDGRLRPLPQMSKDRVAEKIVQEIAMLVRA